ncbi:histidine-phosphotransfer domain HPT domain-containing protein [Hysterangium stoloniferum]|nr:histidine-phosphotransfer domain HPT domain-containing protein [Hysterangium stoloniferum]
MPSSIAKSSPPPPPSSPKEKAKSPQREPEAKTTPASPAPPAPPVQDDTDDIIEMEMLDQNLELDDEGGDHEFSKSIVWAYFDQAVKTFTEMDEAFAAKDLKELSELGHFLKGSSAALGVRKVQASCERIQHYGLLRDDEADEILEYEEALVKIEGTLESVKSEYAEAEKWLKAYYEKLESGAEPPKL